MIQGECFTTDSVKRLGKYFYPVRSDGRIFRRFSSLSLMPAFLRIHIMGHQLVKADCSKFNPTKAVNHNQLGWTFTASKTLNKIKDPAIPLNIFSISFFLNELTIYGAHHVSFVFIHPALTGGVNSGIQFTSLRSVNCALIQKLYLKRM